MAKVSGFGQGFDAGFGDEVLSAGIAQLPAGPDDPDFLPRIELSGAVLQAAVEVDHVARFSNRIMARIFHIGPNTSGKSHIACNVTWGGWPPLALRQP